MNHKVQMVLDFESGAPLSYTTLKEFVSARIHQLGKPQKAVAADMDLSPSQLSRKVSNNPDDTMNLTVDDLERYLETQRDFKPLYYLVEKYLGESSEAALLRQIEQLQAQLKTRKR